MRNSTYQYLEDLQKPNSDSPWNSKDTNTDAYFGTIDIAGYEVITNNFAVYVWAGPSQVLNQMLDKDIIFSLQAYYCCFAPMVLHSHGMSLTHLLFEQKREKTVKTCHQTSHWKYACRYGTYEGILELYYTFMKSSHPFKPIYIIVRNKSNPK